MKFARVNDVTLHYQITRTSGEKPTLVFCNSLGTDARIWRDVIANFTDAVTTVTYDKRGHGLSDIGPDPYTIDIHVADLAGLLDQLSIRNAVVCGLSIGGLIAQGLSSARPDLVRALILCDTGAKLGSEELWNDRIAAVETGGIQSIAQSILERWFSAQFREAGNPALDGYRNMLTRTPSAGYAGSCKVLRDTDHTAMVQAIRVPTLCLVGNDDRVTPPALVKQLASLIPGAQFEVIDNSGHLPCIEQPVRLAGAIRRFLAGLSVLEDSHD